MAVTYPLLDMFLQDTKAKCKPDQILAILISYCVMSVLALLMIIMAYIKGSKCFCHHASN